MFKISPNALRAAIQIYPSILIGKVLLLFLAYLILHYTTPAIYGDYSIAIKTLAIFATVVSLNISGTSKRFLTLYINEKDWLHTRGFMRRFISLTAILFIALIVLMGILGLIALLGVFGDHLNFSELHPLYYALLLLPLVLLSTFLTSVLLAAKRAGFTTVANRFIKRFFVVLAVFAVVIYYGRLDLRQVIFIMGLGILINCLLKLYVFLKHIPLKELMHHHYKNEGLWWRYALTTTSSQLFNKITVSAQLFIIELLRVKEDLVGVYAAFFLIAGLVFSISGIAGATYPQEITLYNENQDLKTLNQTCASYTLLFFILSLFIFMPLAIFAKPIIHFFHPSFTAYMPEFYMMLAAFEIQVILMMPKMTLRYVGYEKVGLKFNILYFFITVIATLPLTYYYGLFGVCLGYLVLTVVKYLFFYLYAKFKIGLKNFVVI